MTFSERFFELRTDNDIKQKEIAQYLNVSVSTVSHYEKGLKLPRPAHSGAAGPVF